ncbi:MAG TPA: hypothetical protein VHT73_19525 [Thermodesulfobacteriota bacterium]|nr:hypothetical protein [Thermodesulfobacteriota bacterium]
MPENKLALQSFPPQLRKLALFVVRSDTPISLKEACGKLQLNYDSVCVQITKQRKKGKDFNDLLNQESFEYLRSRVSEVDRSLVSEAISGTHKDRELFYKRTRILKETPLINMDNRSLTVVVSPSGNVPKSIAATLPEPDTGEIEIEGPPKRP